MKVATTIQITAEEDKQITSLKKALNFASKKAVVMEGVRLLAVYRQNQARVSRLQGLSKKIRKSSLQVNREWAAHSTAVKSW